MKILRDIISPWAVTGVLVWLVAMVVATNWAIPVFTNIGGTALECSPASCPTQYTTDWLAVLIFAGIASSIVAGFLVGLVVLVRGKAQRGSP